jgi:hypothetical protein
MIFIPTKHGSRFMEAKYENKTTQPSAHRRKPERGNLMKVGDHLLRQRVMRFLLPLILLISTSLAADRPNVVVILSDDFGWGSAGCYGADPALGQTPNIDRIAKEGRRFTDGNTTSSVCSLTRYAMLTGRYCWRTLGERSQCATG